ncbi:MAG: ASPIC/UnbV domain-containing protein, partial [Acidobacteriota bacterium]
GLLPDGTVNRDGIGALVRVIPERGRPALAPVTAGASYASQSSLARLFGLGEADTATVEVQWPGGVRNRLEGVRSGERIVFPEIPCDFAASWPSLGHYSRCVDRALDRLRETGHIDAELDGRLRTSALSAYRETRSERGPRDSTPREAGERRPGS